MHAALCMFQVGGCIMEVWPCIGDTCCENLMDGLNTGIINSSCVEVWCGSVSGSECKFLELSLLSLLVVELAVESSWVGRVHCLYPVTFCF
jgi:hypothetical protein